MIAKTAAMIADGATTAEPSHRHSKFYDGPEAGRFGPVPVVNRMRGFMQRHHPHRAIVAAFCLISPAFAAQAETKVDLSTGISYSSGKYGDITSTDVLVVPLSAKIRTGQWTFKVSVPFLRIDGPAGATVVLDDSGGGSGGGGNSGPGGGPDTPEDNGSSGGAAGTGRNENGIGDTSLSATYSFEEIGGSSIYIDVSGRVRLPTGSEDKGLGIGATDYGLSTEIGVDKNGGGGYLSVGRRFLGSVTGLQREDGWQAGVGGWFNATERTSLGAGYDWRESSTTTGTDPAEVYAYVSVKMSDAWRINVNASAGLNDASADYGAGVTLTWRATGR
jgi:hypothetical protein